MNIIPYSRQCIDAQDIGEVIAVLKSDFLTQGPKIPDFEKGLAEYCGSRYAVVFNSGTSALHAAYFAAGLSNQDEFITTPITFVATANAGLYLGAKPVFADIEKEGGNIDASSIAEKVTGRTRLLVPVHYAGHPVDLRKIYRLAKKHDLSVIEDACHALGATYRERKIGACQYSDMTVFSFHPLKHITTGEGGAVLTNNKALYRKLLLFRTHGITKKGFLNKPDGDWYYEMHYLGYNYRMTDIQAALGISQLKKLNAFLLRRRAIAIQYNKSFIDNPYFDIPLEKDYACSSYHLYSIRLKDKFYQKKKRIFAQLRKKGLGVQVHYIPVYWHPYYRHIGYKKGLCPIAEEFYGREVSIPLYPSMTQKDIKSVTCGILEVFNRSGK